MADLRQVRIDKLQKIRSAGFTPYAAKFSRTHLLAEAKTLPLDTEAKVAGRVVLWREMGKMTFATLQDESGRFQLLFKEDVLGAEAYALLSEVLDLGDFLGVEGTLFHTKTGEPTLAVRQWQPLSKALRPPPEKWHGVQNQETAWRQRYLDLQQRPTLERFQLRSRFVRALREFYWAQGFTEVETPMLVNAPSGALASPFRTHHDAYDMDVYLRIAPETFLKECLVGGMDKVFELGRQFRNEGLDPSHLQDFTSVEHYASYWDYQDNMRFTEDMFAAVLPQVIGGLETQIPDRDGTLVTVNFKGPWPKLTIREVIARECGVDIEVSNSAPALLEAMKKANIQLDVPVETLGFGTLVDQLYKKVARPKLIQPTFIINHPIELSPLARRNDENPAITDRFQLVVGGWEIVNAYSELIDPIDQAERFNSQAKAQAEGDHEAHGKDDEFVLALECGCPPCSGWGMGIDRIVALLTQQSNLRDVVLFPLMKPLASSGQQAASSANTHQMNAYNNNADCTLQSNKAANCLLPSAHSLLQHADYGHLLPSAHGLLETHAVQTKAHLIATGAAMEALAKRFNGDVHTWKVAGMLHDLDWDQLDKDYERHCGEPLAKMLEGIAAPEELLGDIRAHYQHKYGADYPLNSQLRKCLYCVDELTGFIIAVTYVRPSKMIGDVEVSSVKKKLKDKGFAAQVDRTQIAKCEELLGIPLDEFIAVTLDAMKGVATELGL